MCTPFLIATWITQSASPCNQIGTAQAIQMPSQANQVTRKAAHWFANSTTEGCFSNWFLPSSTQLIAAWNSMFAVNRILNEVSSADPMGQYYWTSSVVNAQYSLAMNFQLGTFNQEYKGSYVNILRTRCMRKIWSLSNPILTKSLIYQRWELLLKSRTVQRTIRIITHLHLVDIDQRAAINPQNNKAFLEQGLSQKLPDYNRSWRCIVSIHCLLHLKGRT